MNAASVSRPHRLKDPEDAAAQLLDSHRLTGDEDDEAFLLLLLELDPIAPFRRLDVAKARHDAEMRRLRRDVAIVFLLLSRRHLVFAAGDELGAERLGLVVHDVEEGGV